MKKCECEYWCDGCGRSTDGSHEITFFIKEDTLLNYLGKSHLNHHYCEDCAIELRLPFEEFGKALTNLRRTNHPEVKRRERMKAMWFGVLVAVSCISVLWSVVYMIVSGDAK